MTNDEIIPRAQIEQILELLEDWGEERPTLRENYSGRNMYGAECFGIVHNTTDLKLGVVLHNVLGEEKAWEIADQACTDNMGRSTITYFPGYVVEEDPNVKKCPWCGRKLDEELEWDAALEVHMGEDPCENWLAEQKPEDLQ